ncbi:MAG: NUDIX domain-containing protein [Geminicoccaceae bacterium]|nr:MAG: NUDIX domain-containing protein [Geminicoccaceae bacterium]
MRLEIGAVERLLEGWVAVDRLELRHERFDGGLTDWLQRTVLRRGQAVVVLPYDPVVDGVVLIEQFRAGAVDDANSAWLIEAVAGLLDKGGPPEATARRELMEEAGLEALDLVPLYHGYASPGISDEYIFGFVARVDSRKVDGHHGLDEEHEDIRPFVLPFEEAMAWWRQGRIRNLPTLVALLGLAAERERLRALWR